MVDICLTQDLFVYECFKKSIKKITEDVVIGRNGFVLSV
ncbi:hypothetical protein M23134_03812 [Microscilla marina ATCC 23134]|uniref:Uncharacterized protein n=1 Tax=Microscilla marina ATCC 23134 TaxID=313606 RepID=A1ZPK4_MICM2|nr:hypothetical protein M23134_03812 [Microscilla marina ATCC 23134]